MIYSSTHESLLATKLSSILTGQAHLSCAQTPCLFSSFSLSEQGLNDALNRLELSVQSPRGDGLGMHGAELVELAEQQREERSGRDHPERRLRSRSPARNGPSPQVLLLGEYA